MDSILVNNLVQNILREIDEGIHIVDKDGNTVLYNTAMENIEGLNKRDVVGKHILEVFRDWNPENSTLLMAIKEKRVVKRKMQSYFNFSGQKITTENITYPIFGADDSILGAVEIAKNFTNVEKMSNQILSLRKELVKTTTNFENVSRHYKFEDIIGNNKIFLQAIKISKRASKSDSSVLIVGETGTGKELFAQSIHSLSARDDGQFIAQNCAALPETLLESILFGTTKGSFTGAENRAGLFEQANGGTMFLDEINSMSSSLQAKLLRVLQEGYVRRVGGNKDIKIDVRIIAASNVNLGEMIEDGSFRKDLYYRINVINVQIPPLRERKDDIILLTDYYIRKYNKKLDKDVWMISKDLQEVFINNQWKGNIRELKNIIESAMNMVDDEHVITKEHIQSHLDEYFCTINANLVSEDIILSSTEDIEFDGLNEYIERREREIIGYYLKKNDGNVTFAARDLKISRQNLQYKVKKLKI
ncbi:MAG: sigma 54-interacting transcriptional regulator [Acidaminobacteraceae bacterium]